MPDALPITGLFGKVPAHGDFVRRGLPTSFVGPWDAWLQDGMAVARERLGARWAEVWDGAPPWRFALPAGACGPDAVAGVLLPSEDMVGRRFPITLAALLAPGDAVPASAWFAVLEAAAQAGRAGQVDADALAAAIPVPGTERPEILDIVTPAAWQPDEPSPLTMADASALQAFADERMPSAADDSNGPGHGPTIDLAMAAWDAPETLAAAEPADAVAAAPDAVPDLLDIFSAASRSEAPVAADPPVAAPAVVDVLDLLGSAPVEPSMATPPAPEPVASDGTLAFLLGEGGGSQTDDSSTISAPSEGFLGLLPGGASEAPADDTDPLAALIAGGDAPLGGPLPSRIAATPPLVEAVLIPAEFHPLAAPPPAAPAAPSGGGWWTGGGGFRPPAVLPIAALLPTGVFASLLEADA